jgi:excisionase family DNA binding protein
VSLDDGYIRRQTVAEMLRISKQTVRRLEQAGKLTAYKLTDQILVYKLADIRKLMKEVMYKKRP